MLHCRSKGLWRCEGSCRQT
ncbi:hypothetical protein F1737_09145 [Methanoplanus sp. FWC-SCC4]|uniref:Uncharacterized protein n=1 Tax=Methanochimaera problematica TaxID=2609417 RepID=A0AA97I3G6_9EURY|nr:hypothetical protein F1737_09145 [Methanoplanus sp. FWC-SCC4]